MPIKHCSESYRMRGASRYEQWQDLNTEDARNLVRALKKDGCRAFSEKIGEGMSRVFVSPGKSPPMLWFESGEIRAVEIKMSIRDKVTGASSSEIESSG